MMAPPALSVPSRLPETSAAETLSSLFLDRCAARAEATAFAFVRGALDQVETLSHARLSASVHSISARLLRQTAAQDRVLIVLPPGLDFVCAFWACLLTGRVAVPVPAPDAARFKNAAPQLRTVMADAQAAAIVCSKDIRTTLQSMPTLFDAEDSLFLAVDEEVDEPLDPAAVRAAAVAVRPDSLAYLQYTSGSTSAPRGVMLTHEQVLHQCRIGSAGQQLTQDSRILCWLPHHHDYGLVLGVLWPLYTGATAHLMSPLSFLRRPLRWLEAIERFGSTHTGAPNFAYVACLKALDESPQWSARLDTLLNCSCGAEPIHAETIRRFMRAFAPHGLRPDAIKPSYGMAETVLGICNTRPDRVFEVDCVDAQALAAQRVVRVPPDAPGAVTVVACGQPFDDMQVIAVQPEQAQALGDDRVGELWVRGVSVGSGYWQQPERTRETFGARLADGVGPWLRTGDLGYLREGTVYVTGRLKDLIILNGRNVYPQDIEWTAQAVDPSLRQGHGAAFQVSADGGEAVVLVQELDKRERDADLPALAAAMRRAVAREHELPLHTLVLVRSGSLPRTSSGKIRRHRCAELFQAGELQVVLQQRFGPDGATLGESDLRDLVERLRSATGETEQQAAMAALLLAACADALGRETQALSLAHSAVENGLDSLSAVRVLARLDEALDLAIAPGALLAQPDLESGAHALWRAWRSRAPAAASPHRDAPLTPDRVPLAELDATHLERLAARVPGGPANVQDVYRLAPLQEGLLVLAQLQPRGDAYVARQIGAFADRAALDAALQGLQHLVQRHGAWRTLFAWDGLPHPVQVVLREASLPVHEHAAAPGDDALARLEALSDPLTHTLDLAQAPLVRCDVLHDAAHGRWLLALRVHHLVFDQVSFDLVREELDAIVAGREAELPPAPDYRDFVQATRAGQAADHDAFFRQQFADLDAGTRAFGLERAEPGEVRSHRLRLPHAQAARLRRAARQHGCTSATLTHTAWALLLAHAAQRHDPVFGTVLSGRLTPAARLGRTVGLFVNTLPLRLPLAGLSAARALRQTQSALRELVRHEQAPLTLAQHAAGLPHGEPLFNTSFNHRHQPLAAPGGLGRPVSRWERTHYPIAVAIDDLGDGFEIEAQCAAGIDPQALAAQLQQALQGLADALIDAPDTPALAIEVLPPAQRRQQLVDWNAGAHDAFDARPVHRLVEAQAAATPEATAVVFGDQSLSYAGLNAQANRLARALQALGAGPGVTVGLHLQRSLELPLAYLAVLKSGAAFVPLDPELPAARLAQLLADTAAPIVLTQSAQQLALQAAVDGAQPQWLALDAPPPSLAAHDSTNLALDLAPDALAYVLYTSGSTGMPKGVMVPHVALSSMLQWTAQALDLRAGDRWLQSIAISFDPSVVDLLMPLMRGAATVAPAPGRLRGDAAALALELATQRITHVMMVPSLLRPSLDQPALAQATALRHVVSGGEALPSDLIEAFRARLPQARLANFYGPTEATVTAVACVNALDTPPGAPVPIGRPIAGTRCHVLGPERQLLPAGAEGELFIGGRGLALGYLNRPELTAERFVPDPFNPGQRLYATGDRVRWLPDGQLQYLGRTDDQVKIRGVRIELGEVEAAINALPEVKQAVVVAREDRPNQRRLVAYVVGEPGWEVARLRAALQVRLPEAMVPFVFVPLERLPLLPSGKPDRRALPSPDGQDLHQSAAAWEPPQGPIEECMATIWQELLGVPRASRQDHFFDLGGHSLLAMQLVSRLGEAGLRLSVRAVFDHPTLSELARLVDTATHGQETDEGEVPWGAIRITPDMVPLAELGQDAIDRVIGQVSGGAANVQDIYRLAPLQEGLLFHHRLDSRDDIYASRSILAFDDEASVERYLDALRRVLARHDTWRTLYLWEELPHPVQVVLREVDLPVTRLTVPHGDDALATLEQASDPSLHRMDVRQAPLARCLVAHDSANARWLLVLRLHHLIADHVSNEIAQSEIAAMLGGHEADFPAPPRYRRFVRAARSVDQDAQRAFFTRELGEVRTPTVPYGVISLDARHIHSHQRRVDPALSARARAAARHFGVTPAALLHTAWALVVARTSGSDDVVFGTVLSGRLSDGGVFARTVGLFINTLPLRVRLRGMRVGELLQQVRMSLNALLPHEQATLSLAQRCSGVNALTPLFTAAFNYRHTDAASSLDVHTATLKPGALGRVIASQERTNFPLSVAVDDLGNGFSIEAQCAPDIDPAAVVEQLQWTLQCLVDALEQSPNAPALGIDLLSPAQRQWQLDMGRVQLEQRLPAEPVHRLFEAQARTAPEARAAIFGGYSLGYAALNASANRLARHMQAMGLVPGALVGLHLERSLDLPVAMLAVLKSGAALLTLDPSLPSSDLARMVDRFGVAMVLTQSHLHAGLSDALGSSAASRRWLVLDAAPAELATRDDRDLQQPIEPDTVAVWQIASGPGQSPEAVKLSHAALGHAAHCTA